MARHAAALLLLLLALVCGRAAEPFTGAAAPTWIHLSAPRGDGAAHEHDVHHTPWTAPSGYEHLQRPLSAECVQRIKAIVGERSYRGESRWLNAVSAWTTTAQRSELTALDCISHMHSVGRRRKPVLQSTSPARIVRQDPDPDLFGASKSTLEPLGLVSSFLDGVNGTGVRVLVIDSGFRRSVPALQHLNVVGEWDFVNQDGDTGNDGHDPADQDAHGTAVLSVLAAYAPGQMIGGAAGAEYLLAKAEDLRSETPLEEDLFIQALEWGVNNGAKIVSSSVGYDDWYPYGTLDGHTAPITQAVNIASALGVLIVTAAGNTAAGGIVAPGDSPYVIAVGSLSAEGNPTLFSAVGPTADGRIKPELTVRGVDITVATTDGSYATQTGTSLSAPLVTAVAVLCLQQRPKYGPAQIREALLSTANHAEEASNHVGWGRPNIVLAMETQATALPPQCINGCSGHGSCATGLCTCDPMYYHHDCSLRKAMCVVFCNGQCDDNLCYCAHGMTGVWCTTPYKVPDLWKCDPLSYDAGDGKCDCDCGLPDPDCIHGSTQTLGCDDDAGCFNGVCRNGAYHPSLPDGRKGVTLVALVTSVLALLMSVSIVMLRRCKC